jgi:hypothetical protein
MAVAGRIEPVSTTGLPKDDQIEKVLLLPVSAPCAPQLHLLRFRKISLARMASFSDINGHILATNRCHLLPSDTCNFLY